MELSVILSHKLATNIFENMIPFTHTLYAVDIVLLSERSSIE
jgi:hypothetical protein